MSSIRYADILEEAPTSLVTVGDLDSTPPNVVIEKPPMVRRRHAKKLSLNDPPLTMPVVTYRLEKVEKRLKEIEDWIFHQSLIRSLVNDYELEKSSGVLLDDVTFDEWYKEYTYKRSGNANRKI